MLVSRWSYVDGVRVHALAGGDGPAVVLVHGYGVSGRYLQPLAEALAARCSVLVVDLPGHGRSGRRRGASGIGELASVLGAWLDAVGLERPVLVASSMGCQIATKLAVRRPERVGPLVLIGPTVDPAKRRARHQIFGALRDAAHEPALLVALAAREGVCRDTRELLAAARSALADRIEERLPLIEQPSVVIHAGNDGFVSRAWASEVAELLPQGRLVVVPGEPHAIPFTQPELVAGIVWDLMEEGDHAARELARRLPHGHMPAAQSDDPRPRQRLLPTLGEPPGYEAVVVAPHE
ncbi:MAG TPA: alpha/beta hydrolase [Gaiellaceae bacterium]|jgi:pimeloyl-ACP methyl ester carboxylesterase